MNPNDFFQVDDLDIDPIKKINELGFNYFVECHERGEPDETAKSLLINYLTMWLDLINNENMFEVNDEEIKSQIIKSKNPEVLKYYFTNITNPISRYQKVTTYFEIDGSNKSLQLVRKCLPTILNMWRENNYEIPKLLLQQDMINKKKNMHVRDLGQLNIFQLLMSMYEINQDNDSFDYTLVDFLIEVLFLNETHDTLKMAKNDTLCMVYDRLWELIMFQKLTIGSKLDKYSPIAFFPNLFLLVMRLNDKIWGDKELNVHEMLKTITSEFLTNKHTPIFWQEKANDSKRVRFSIYTQQFFLMQYMIGLAGKYNLPLMTKMSGNVGEQILYSKVNKITKAMLFNGNRVYQSDYFTQNISKCLLMGVDWIKLSEDSYPYPIIENMITFIGMYVYQYPPKTPLNQNLLQFLIEVVSGTVINSLHHRETCLFFAINHLKYWNPPLETRFELLKMSLNWFVNMDSDSSYPKIKPRIEFYEKFNYLIPQKNVGEAFTYCCSDKIIMMQFFDSLFSDVVTTTDYLYDGLESLNNNTDDGMTPLNKKRQIVAIIQYLNKVIHFIFDIVSTKTPELEVILTSPEIVSQMAICLVKSLDDFANRFHGELSGFSYKDSAIADLIAEYLKTAIKILIEFKNNAFMMDTIIKQKKYTPIRFANIVTSILSFGTLSDEEQMMIYELNSILEHMWESTQRKIMNLTIKFKENIPDEFIDIISGEPIKKPYVLETSKPLIVDYNSISRWLLNHETDPFNKAPHTFSQFLDYNKTDEAKGFIQQYKDKFNKWLADQGIDNEDDFFMAWEKDSSEKLEEITKELNKTKIDDAISDSSSSSSSSEDNSSEDSHHHNNNIDISIINFLHHIFEHME
jgi:hypothetical protein